MTSVKASICLSTYEKPYHLRRVLQSIEQQEVHYPYEVIVVDDGSPNIATESVCQQFDFVKYYRINRDPSYRNPAVARNYAYELANGEILILQSDDVVHCGNTIDKLIELLQPGKFVISTVFNVDFNSGDPIYCHGGRWYQLTGPVINKKYSPNPLRPLFFLGSVYREDVYAIGGCDEDFIEPGRDDVWFADCLINGLGLQPIYTDQIVGHHLHHERPADLSNRAAKSMIVYKKKVLEARRTGVWKSSKGLQNRVFVDVG